MFQAILNTHPYHIDSLLQLSEICKMGEDYQMAAELIGDWTIFAIGAILILSFGWIPMLSLIMNRLFLGLQPKKSCWIVTLSLLWPTWSYFFANTQQLFCQLACQMIDWFPIEKEWKHFCSQFV